jgi:NADH dehydrogenase
MHVGTIKIWVCGVYSIYLFMNKKHIVIVGAGFAGITALQKLDKSGLFEITLITPKSHFEYYPGLYRVVGEKAPFEVFVPFRYLLPKRVTFLHDSVLSIDIAHKKIDTQKNGIFSYDILIMATGMVPSDFGITGVSQYAHFVTSLTFAIESKKALIAKLQAHVISQEKNPFTIVIAGAGPTGVELAGELSSFLRSFTKTYHVPLKNYRIKIIQRDKDVLPQLDSKVRKTAVNRLRRLGVELLLEHAITEVTQDTVVTSNGPIVSSFFFWTAGAMQSPLVTSTVGFTLSARKKVIVSKELLAEGTDSVYVLGDNAETEFSGLAQIAEQDGAFVGSMLVFKEQGKPYKPYVPRKPIFVIPIGNWFGILGIKGKVFSGIIPWILRYAVDMRFFFFRLKFADFISLSIERKLR